MLLALAVSPSFVFAQEVAQQSQIDVLVINPKYVLENSQIGLEIVKRERDELEALKAQDEEISGQLLAEERALAEKRSQMDAETFAPLANAFAEKTELTRADFLGKNQERANKVLLWKRNFETVMVRASEALAKQYGTKMIVRSDNLLWADPSIDISPVVVTYLDQLYTKTPDQFDALIFASENDAETTTSTEENLNKNSEEPTNDTKQ